MIVCIDIGGGTTRVGFSGDGKTFTKIIKFATEDIFEDEVGRMAKEINAVKVNVKAIIIAAAGLVDRKNGIIISWGQKRSWWGKNIFRALSKYFPRAQMLLENDANLAGLGEAIFGAGKRYSLVGYVTLSTGVGGGLISNKRIADYNFGIEPGHQIVNIQETKIWSCGQKGCYESYASGTAFKQIFGISPETCTDKDVWGRYGRLVAAGMANLVALWSPEIIVIGGGVAHKFDKFIKPLREELTNLLPMYVIPEIAKSLLDEPGLYGDLAYYAIKENK